jgi:hypothetical protein
LLLFVHEACHGVVARRLNANPKLIEYFFIDEGENLLNTGGRVSIDDEPPPDKFGRWSRRYCFDAIAIALAGNAGESILWQRTRFDPAAADFLRDRREEVSGVAVTDLWLDRVWPPLSQVIREQIMRREWERAKKIALEEWNAVRAILAEARRKLDDAKDAEGNITAGSLIIEGNELTRLCSSGSPKAGPK